MKKLFAAILALGLIVAVSGTASAVDVKVSGSYYVVGVYDSNPSLKDSDASYSRAYFFQRIRIQPEFKIAEGLSFTARMDAMEGAWDTSTAAGNRSAQSVDTGRNFDWERGYVTFNTGIGKFDVGYMSAGTFGTVFSDSETTRPRIKLTTKVGPLVLVALYEKRTEGNTVAAPNYADADYTAYYLAPIYPFKGGSAGILYGFLRSATTRPAGFSTEFHIFEPYFKATFGSVYVEGEFDYNVGKQVKSEIPGVADTDWKGYAAYLMAKTNLGPASVGAQVGWSRGNDIATLNDNEGGLGGGADWNPALILMNDELATWSGGDTNTLGVGNTSAKANFILFNLFGNYKVTPKLSMGAAFTYAKLDQETVANQVSKDLGYEFDVTASYKLYDNLTYMVGAGYLFTGDAFKGANAAAKVDDDYILMNKLSLSF
jgi:hypothetical protein